MELLDLSQVVSEMKVTLKALRSLIDRGKFPHSKVCGRVLVERAQLTEFIFLSRRLTAADAAAFNKHESPTA